MTEWCFCTKASRREGAGSRRPWTFARFLLIQPLQLHFIHTVRDPERIKLIMPGCVFQPAVKAFFLKKKERVAVKPGHLDKDKYAWSVNKGEKHTNLEIDYKSKQQDTCKNELTSWGRKKWCFDLFCCSLQIFASTIISILLAMFI